ncbi:MAG: apolipoprotein N-acyltransferase [Frankiaceae bacterium]|nr:apolipoprotein N-acyltransferase [Frankiaceae bacterium]
MTTPARALSQDDADDSRSLTAVAPPRAAGPNRRTRHRTAAVDTPDGRRTAHSRTQTSLRLLGAAVAGVLQLLAFPPYHHWWTAPIGVAVLVGSLYGVRARFGALLGFVAGLTFFVPLLAWMRPVGSDAWLLLSAVEVGLTAGLGAALAAVLRLRGWAAWVPAVWIAWDAVRARWPFGGFSWGRLGFSQDEGPWGRLASIGGVSLVTAVVVAAGTALAWLAVSGALGRQKGLAGAAVVLAACATGPLAVQLPTGGQSVGGPAQAVVAIIQGNVPANGMDAFDRSYEVLSNHVKVTEDMAAAVAAGTVPQPDAVIWPENAADVSPQESPRAAALVEEAARAARAPLLIGAVITTATTRENAGVVWEAGVGETERYAKRHLVPFGEYVPFRSLIATGITRFDRVPRDFTPGTGTGRLDVGPVRLSDVMCFEVAYDGLVRAGVRDGGRLISVQSNNATYGEIQSQQQLSMARLRAMEHGRAVVVASTDGISAVISPDGTLVRQSAMHQATSFVETLPLRDSLTLADRAGGWPEAVGGLAGLLGVLLVMMGSLRRRLTTKKGTQ